MPSPSSSSSSTSASAASASAADAAAVKKVAANPSSHGGSGSECGGSGGERETAAAARLAAAELVAECQAADLHAVKRRLFQLEQQLGALEKSAEYTEGRLWQLQLVLILCVALAIGGYCVFRFYGLVGLLIGSVAVAGIGALMYFDEGSSR